MATITIGTVNVAVPAEAAKPKRPSFFNRLVQAMIESRQRKAEIEARRVQALIGKPRQELDYFLLPFSGE